jgi:gamma-glutamyltranspeptidase
LLINAINACGTGPIFWRGVSVYNTYGLMISPDPASTTATVTIVKGDSRAVSNSTTALSNADNADNQTTYTVNIYNSFGTLIYSTKKTGDTFNISIDNFKNGTYILTVNNGKQSFSQCLIVKH